MLSASLDKTINLWDIELYKQIRTYKGHTSYVTCVKKAPGNKIISGDWSGEIKIWNLETGERIQTINAHVKYC